MFKCKVCIEKDKMISELSKQIDILRTLAYPSHTENAQAFIQSLEANKVLGGETNIVELSSTDLTYDNKDFDNWD